MFSGIDPPGLFSVAGLRLNLTPGADLSYIVRNGVRGGRRTFSLLRRPACAG